MVRPKPGEVWAALFTVGVTYEAYGLTGGRSGYTLSENTRALFRTTHPVGKATFLAAYVGFSTWFIPHIVREANDLLDQLADGTL